MGKKVSLHRFLADQITSAWKKMCFFASYSMNNRFLLVARHTLTMGLRKAGAVNFMNSLSLFTMKKVHTKTKNSQGTYAMPGKSQGS